MMPNEVLLNILCIAAILTIGIDYLRFDEVITSLIKRIATRGKFSEPFNCPVISCSTCSTWWVSLAYITFAGHLTLLDVLVVLGVACCTPLLAALIRLVHDMFAALFGLFYK